MATTPIFDILLPTPGADDDAWAPILNDAIIDLEAEVSRVDGTTAGIALDLSGKVAKAGDVMSGFLTLNADPVDPLHAATRGYVDAAITAIPPSGITQGDADLRYVNTAGDTMTGALSLPADPTTALQAATKQYVDTHAGGASVTTSPTPPVSPAAGDLWFDSARLITFVYYDDGNTQQWVQTIPTSMGMTQTDADARYVNLTGDTMTGALQLPAANPTGAAEAAHKGYVDAQVATRLTPAAADTAYVNVTGDTMTGDLVIAKASAAIVLAKTASGQNMPITGKLGAANRWSLSLGDNAAESTGNAGSNFSVARFNDAGTYIDSPLSISRVTGTTTMAGALTLAPATGPALIQGRTSAPPTAGDDTFNIWARAANGDGGVIALRGAAHPTLPNGVNILAGTAAARKVWEFKQDGTAGFPGSLSVSAILQTSNVFGGGTGNELSLVAGFNLISNPAWPTTNGGWIAVRGNTNGNYAAGAVACYSGSGNFGVALLNGAIAWSALSDEREKHILSDIADGLQAILALKPIRFRFRFEDAEAPARIGFGAGNVQQHIPEAVTPVPKIGEGGLPTGEERLSLAPTELLPHMVSAVQQMAAQIDALAARIATLEGTM